VDVFSVYNPAQTDIKKRGGKGGKTRIRRAHALLVRTLLISQFSRGSTRMPIKRFTLSTRTKDPPSVETNRGVKPLIKDLYTDFVTH